MGWCSTFWVVTVTGDIALIGIWKLIPHIEDEQQAGFRKEFAVVRQGKVLVAHGMTFISACSVNCSSLQFVQ
ncbi:MFS transporter [Paenibacillus sp. MMS18-CY102]|uniref:MFS transporter n=1 Tax=Paenibacillus sp. MMS18-CY102 TaxID=2682849 RepID=UPI001365D225|nr:MFS transporter [Paenibacillus sp. MMS18-CY102]MWC28855.1 hypothetical protein [Paenibacillus sp. MMS18-CY102]